MDILFKSFHNINVPENIIRTIPIPEDFDGFMTDFLLYSLQNGSIKRYKIIDKNSEVLSCIQGIAQKSLINAQEDTDATLDLSNSIALKLLREEQAAQQMIEKMGISIQRGSLIQTMLRTNEGALFFIVAKVEHSAWYEGESLEKKFGFPGDKKSVWKSAIIPLETTGILSEGDIKVYRNNSSKYWTDKFLEVQEIKSDETNTREVFDAVQSVLRKNVRKQSERDYLILRNALIQKMKTPQQVNYGQMIDDLVGSYIPDVESLDINTIKEKLLELPETKTFDTQFNTIPAVIKERKRIEKYLPSAGIELILVGAIEDFEHVITSETIDGGRRYLKIRCDDNKTYEAFAIKQPRIKT